MISDWPPGNYILELGNVSFLFSPPMNGLKFPPREVKFHPPPLRLTGQSLAPFHVHPIPTTPEIQPPEALERKKSRRKTNRQGLASVRVCCFSCRCCCCCRCRWPFLQSFFVFSCYPLYERPRLSQHLKKPCVCACVRAWPCLSCPLRPALTAFWRNFPYPGHAFQVGSTNYPL